MNEKQPLLNLILRAVALAMGVAAVVLNLLGATPPQATITLLGLGVFALALDALSKNQ